MTAVDDYARICKDAAMLGSLDLNVDVCAKCTYSSPALLAQEVVCGSVVQEMIFHCTCCWHWLREKATDGVDQSESGSC